MSAGQVYTLNVKQTTADNGGIGDALKVQELESLTIQLAAGGGTGTVQFEGSIDNVNWFALGAAVTASGAFDVPFKKIAYVRSHTTVNVAGGSGYTAALCGAMRGE